MNETLTSMTRKHSASRPIRAMAFATSIELLESRIAPSTLVGLTTTNQLVMFDSAEPAKILHKVKISGVAQGEDIVSMDARPSDGLIYGVTNVGTLYRLNPYSGVATLVGDPGIDLAGKTFAVDFNPAVDRLRFVSDGELNVRLNPNNGALAGQDTDLSYDGADPNTDRNPAVTAVAYNRNFQGAALTTLYGIDSTLNTLVRIGGVDGVPSPNGGLLTTVGTLGVNPGARVGFDIAGDGDPGTAYATMQVGAKTSLYLVNLDAGASTAVGKVGKGNLKLDAVTVLPREEIVFAVTGSNRLISFRADNPGALQSVVSITGLVVGEQITEIDFRPSSGELFGLTNLNRMMRIDPATGKAAQLGTPLDTTSISTAGVRGFDFNPTVDRLRIVNSQETNLRYNPYTYAIVDSDSGTAGIQVDTPLAYDAGDVNAGQNPNIGAVAYDRNDNSAITATTLWAIDSDLNTLVTIGGVNGTPSPNGGLIFTAGALVLGDGSSVDVSGLSGFDIADRGANGEGVGLFVSLGGGVSSLYAVNLNSTGTTNQPVGSVRFLGAIAGGDAVVAMAIAPAEIEFVVPTYAAIEKAGSVATITIARHGGTGSAVSVLLSTFDITAIAGFDFTAQNNVPVVFNRGETLKRIEIPILDDSIKELDERVVLSLSAVSGSNSVLGMKNAALLTIRANPK